MTTDKMGGLTGGSRRFQLSLTFHILTTTTAVAVTQSPNMNYQPVSIRRQEQPGRKKIPLLQHGNLQEFSTNFPIRSLNSPTMKAHCWIGTAAIDSFSNATEND